MAEKNRVCLWDNLKFILITLMVVGHFLDEYTANSPVFKSVFLFIYTFHMPLFFFISGMFHSNKRIANKVVSFLALAMLVKAVTYVVQYVLGENPSFSLTATSAMPWFMICMAMFELTTYLVRDVDSRLVLGLAVLVALFAGYDSFLGDRFVFLRYLVFFPVYYFGCCVDHVKLEKLSSRKSLKIAAAAVLIIWLILCLTQLDYMYWLRQMFTGRHLYSDLKLNLGLLYRVIAYAATAVIGFAVILVTPTSRIPFVSTAGSRTLQVYFWHRPALYVLSHFSVPALMCATAPGMLAWVVLAVLLSVLFSLPAFAYPTDWIMKLKNMPGKG